MFSLKLLSYCTVTYRENTCRVCSCNSSAERAKLYKKEFAFLVFHSLQPALSLGVWPIAALWQAQGSLCRLLLSDSKTPVYDLAT